jgi:hypothetical protein
MKYLFHVDDRSVADQGDELSIQVRFRSRMKMLAPSVRIVATPNAGKRTAWAAIKAKSEGMAKGFPDVNCYWSNGLDEAAVPGFAVLEFKDRSGSLSPDQVDWLNFLHRAGFPCGCFRSTDTAIAFLRKHGAPFIMQEAA